MLSRILPQAYLTTLSRKMTLFYGALFVVALGLVVIGSRIGIERYAERIIDREMTSASKVFQRISSMRYDQMQQAAHVLASDYGFREAAATADAPTIDSALASLRGRLGISHAFLVGLDGKVVGLEEKVPREDLTALWDALDEGATSGVLKLGDHNYRAVAAPVKAPVLSGWVVFANPLDAAEMASLANLSALRLRAQIVPADKLGHDVQITRSEDSVATERSSNGERLLVQASPMQNFGRKGRPVLLLEYSLTRALSEYTPMLYLLFGFGLVGIAVTVAGSWYLSRKLARPIEALDAAARRVSSGEHVQVLPETNDEIGRLAVSFNKMVCDIEDREQQITHLAFHDVLTDLPNRALLREHMSMHLARASIEKPLILLCLDLDNFKSVNDTLGHPTGDALLCEVASRLKSLIGEGFVARLGGDEFAIILDDIEKSGSKIANNIIAAIAEPFNVNGHRIVIGTSIGIATAPLDGADSVSLLKNADLALYRAKQDGKGSFRYFESAMDAEAQERRSMEVDLHDALSSGQLELYFQPLFGLSQGRVTAFEALLRWNHPVRGMVSPVQFIPLAEETGLIIPIGEWVLREACRIAAAWPRNIRVAVNISPVQFRSSALNRIIVQALAESGIDPNQLELEITESLFIENVEATLASLHNVRALGVRVALDDFGTGYSSLSYLRSFPFDKIKIDRSFIMDLLERDGATAIIKSITSLAEALGMETTAEGVENVDQFDILRAQGCTQIQGFYFSRPLTVDAVNALLLSDGRKDAQAA